MRGGASRRPSGRPPLCSFFFFSEGYPFENSHFPNFPRTFPNFQTPIGKISPISETLPLTSSPLGRLTVTAISKFPDPRLPSEDPVTQRNPTFFIGFRAFCTRAEWPQIHSARCRMDLDGAGRRKFPLPIRKKPINTNPPQGFSLHRTAPAILSRHLDRHAGYIYLGLRNVSSRLLACLCRVRTCLSRVWLCLI